MNLNHATREFVANKQAMGTSFETEARILRAFVRQIGVAVAIGTVTSDDVLRYLNGRNGKPVTTFWHRKHDALSGFWDFAIRRGYTDWSPVPARRPEKPARFVPYIYTREELKQLLNGVNTYQKKWHKLEPITFRAILLLLYGAGLRTSEPLHLTSADVNLAEATLTIRRTKFYKTRCIALNPQLHSVLADYDLNRRRRSTSTAVSQSSAKTAIPPIADTPLPRGTVSGSSEERFPCPTFESNTKRKMEKGLA
jgi:integrase/recombinase XerD